MAPLLAQSLGAELVVLDGETGYGPRRQALRRLPRRRGSESCLFLAPLPEHLNAVLRFEHWWRGYAHVSAWVIDSFRDDTIPDVARALGHFDHLFLGDAEVVDTWHKVTRTPVSWVPFGTDALGAAPRTDRPVDLQRIGRQPALWQDDNVTARNAAEAGVTFAGSAPFGDSHEANNALLDSAMARAKFTLSFSNTAAPAGYTHSSVEYLTARWLDALSHGATVAGVAPRCRSTSELLWDGAVLAVSATDRTAGLSAVAEAVTSWSPQQSMQHRVMSLRRTDWRWRFRDIATTLGVHAPLLESELTQLEERALGLSAL